MLKTGIKAPDFSLPDQNGEYHTLRQYRGQKVIVYFYPKDSSSGCTKEACSFRDRMPKIRKNGAVILGISADSVKAHKKFALNNDLPFTLLSDETKEVIQAYDVLVDKNMYGRTYKGIERSTYLIDEDGKIIKAYQKVKPGTHPDDILEDLQ